MFKDKRGETVSVDPMLQKIISISTHDKTVNLGEVFKYELSPYLAVLCLIQIT